MALHSVVIPIKYYFISGWKATPKKLPFSILKFPFLSIGLKLPFIKYILIPSSQSALAKTLLFNFEPDTC
jgi:hypothetical protein